jgi:hypothetical protein
MKRARAIAKSALWPLLSIAAALSMIFYITTIWSAGQAAHFSDLYAPWSGTRALLLEHRNPYSPEVAHEIQTVIYGASSPASATDPEGLAGGFAYPPYAAFLLWPISHLSFSAASTVFLWLSFLDLLLAIYFWLRLFSFPVAGSSTLAIAIFTAGSLPALQAMQLHNLTLIAASTIALSLFLLSADFQILAGIAVAIATFKPQFVVLLIPWLALWSFSDWHRRRKLVWSFLLSLALLLAASEWITPGSLRSFLSIALAYRHYTYGHSVLDVWFTPVFGVFAAIILLVAVLWPGWKLRSQPADSASFLIATALTLAATLVVIPTLAPHAQLLLFPGFLCLLRFRSPQPAPSRALRLLRIAAWALLAWQWISAAGLALASTSTPVAKLLRWWQVPLYTSPLIPLGLAAALALLARNQLTPTAPVAAKPGALPSRLATKFPGMQ